MGKAVNELMGGRVEATLPVSITPRIYLAGQAMQGLLAQGFAKNSSLDETTIAWKALDLADAVLARAAS